MPLEWLTDIKPKRFPLIWDELERRGVSLATWRELLPDTLEVKDAKGKEGYIFKPACGRVGEKISIKEACRDSLFIREKIRLETYFWKQLLLYLDHLSFEIGGLFVETILVSAKEITCEFGNCLVQYRKIVLKR